MPRLSRSENVAAAQLVLEGVTKVFGREPEAALRRFEKSGKFGPDAVVGVCDVSLTIPKGQTFVLMGLSGSGKSTLLRLMNGLHRPTAGRVRAGGVDLTGLTPRELVRVRRRTFSGMVFQSFALLPYRTALGNVAFGLELQGVKRRERLERAQATLELVGLGSRGCVYPHELSGGMQQRLGLARALAAEGDILLMDEPFSALDPITRRELQDELGRLQARLAKTMVLVTHDLTEALKLGDRVALLRGGRLEQVGTPEEIVTRPANAYVEAFVAGFDKTSLLTAQSVMGAPPDSYDYGVGVGLGRWVSPDTPLAEVVRLSSEGTTPLSVVSADGRLVGLITAQHVLAALAERRTAALKGSV